MFHRIDLQPLSSDIQLDSTLIVDLGWYPFESPLDVGGTFHKTYATHKGCRHYVRQGSMPIVYLPLDERTRVL